MQLNPEGRLRSCYEGSLSAGVAAGCGYPGVPVFFRAERTGPPRHAPAAPPGGRAGRGAGPVDHVACRVRLGGHQVADEDERLPRPDHVPGAAVPVGQGWRDNQLPAAADLHALHALVPAGDDLPGAEPEAQRFAAVPARVELLAGRVGDPDVVHPDRVTGTGHLAVAFPDVGDLQVRGRLALGKIDLGLTDAHRCLPFAATQLPHLMARLTVEASWCTWW